MFGRAGCYTAHDHPGFLTDFPLAVDYPGGARHDLGFYELVFTFVMFVVFEIVRRKYKSAPGGRIAILIALVYSPVRFALDFMRIGNKDPSGLHGDVRYLGLTPAQYAFAFLFLLCVYLLLRKQPAPETPAPAGKSAKRKAAKAR